VCQILAEQEQVKLGLAAQKSNPERHPLGLRSKLSTKWWQSLNYLLHQGLEEYMKDLASGELSTDNAGQADIATLQRVSYIARYYGSPNSFSSLRRTLLHDPHSAR